MSRIPVSRLLYCGYRVKRVGWKPFIEDGKRVHSAVERILSLLGSGQIVAEPELGVLLEVDGCLYEVTGKPDMIVRREDGLEVIEVKTCGHDRSLTASELIQVLTYAMMLGDKKVSARLLRIVKDGESIRVRSTLIRLTDRLKKHVECELKARLRFLELASKKLGLPKNETPLPGAYCTRCEVRSECPLKEIADFVAEYHRRTGQTPPYAHLTRMLLRLGGKSAPH